MRAWNDNGAGCSENYIREDFIFQGKKCQEINDEMGTESFQSSPTGLWISASP